MIPTTEHTKIGGDSPWQAPNDRPFITEPTYIEDNVWIGENAVVLPGSRIGFGSIIGANAVVSGDIPPYSIAVGAPAHVVKKWNESLQEWEVVKHDT